MDEDEFYVVEKILERKKVGHTIKYKVKWEGYPLESDCTWVNFLYRKH